MTVVLATFNARFAHASGALRALAANWEGPRPLVLVEGTLEDDPVRFAERLLAEHPALVAFSVSLWNVRLTGHTARVLRRVRPDLPLIAGGPELVADGAGPELADLFDLVLQGEADLAFGQICEDLLARSPNFDSPPDSCPASAGHLRRPQKGAGSYGDMSPHSPRTIVLPPPDLDLVRLPVDEFSDLDLAHRVCYVETSRGCPMNCAFCTAAGTGVRRFPTDRVLAQLQALWDRGLRRFKFLDRSIHHGDYKPVLEFFLARPEPVFVHFELTPHRLESPLAFLLAEFPPGQLQLEIGVQTLDPAVSRAISRPFSDVLEETLDFCVHDTDAHVHADLIAGLPGETLASFAAGFDHLHSLGVHEIQLGILKRLRGTRLCRIMPEGLFNPEPPYDVLFTDTLTFEDVQRLKRMARYWDLVANSGNFRQTLALLLAPGAFQSFLTFSDGLFSTAQRTHGIELNRLAEYLFLYLTDRMGQDREGVRRSLEADYDRCGRTSRPAFLQTPGRRAPPSPPPPPSAPDSPRPPRQRRHSPS